MTASIVNDQKLVSDRDTAGNHINKKIKEPNDS